MNKMYFANKADFDVVSMMTFGVSVKETNDAIGYFGTGFKYAVAIILRLGGSITVHTGGETHLFSINKKTVRGKDFDLVCMDGKEIGFTTHLGAKWEPWQAFREIYSNCLDEDGQVFINEKPDFPTIVEVECDELYEAWIKRDQYFLSTEPLYKNRRVEVHPNYTGMHYYKGVAVAEAGESLFAYNITSHVTLTEDRTAQYPSLDITDPIAEMIVETKFKDLIEKIFKSKFDADRGISFSIYATPSEEFIATCRKLIDSDQGIPISAEKILARHIDNKGIWPKARVSKVRQGMIDKALALLSSIDIEATDYPIEVVKGLGEGVMGRAHNDTIYLSMIPFQLGTKQVASTILEEYVHLSHGCGDFDRRMQSWLFDKILSIAEEHRGEAI